MRKLVLFLFATLLFSGFIQAQGDLILPQLAVGGGWGTQIWLYNSSTKEIQATARFFDDDGKPLSLDLGSLEIKAPTVQFSVPSQSTILLSLFPEQGTQQLIQGWAKITPIIGTLNGTAVLRQSVNEATVPLHDGRLPTPLQTMFYNNGGDHITGLACVNFGSTSLTLPITVYTELGQAAGSETILLNPGQHVAFSLLDRYPKTAFSAGFITLRPPGAAFLSCFGLSFFKYGGMTSILPQ